MDFLHAFILSAIEGVTEFLPISSTGHLILASHALGIPDTEFVKSFEIIIQLGAILAVIVYYFKTLIHKRQYWSKLFLAFLPTAIVGFTLYPLIKHVLLGSPIFTLLALFIGGITLILVEILHKEKESHVADISHLTQRQAILIGCFQAISVIPGVSRSAATIMGGMLTGVKRQASVEFSFLLAIPTMLAASSLDLLKSHATITSSEFEVLVIGFIGAFIFALISIRYFIQYVRTHSFISFGIYRIILSIVYFLVILH